MLAPQRSDYRFYSQKNGDEPEHAAHDCAGWFPVYNRAMKKIVSTPEAPAAVGPYSQAVRVGPMLFTAGQIPLDPQSGQIVSQDISEQTRRVLDNLTAVLRAEGMEFSNIVKTTVFMTNLGDFQTMNEVYGSYFSDQPPARSTVQVSALPKGAQVEIEVVAVASNQGGKSVDTWE
jgi:2-iminobutanoate/2-iminopropanoate deaminase